MQIVSAAAPEALLHPKPALFRTPLLPFGVPVAGLFGFVFGHELAVLGFAKPAAAFVINAAVEVDPNLVARLGGGDVRC